MSVCREKIISHVVVFSVGKGGVSVVVFILLIAVAVLDGLLSYGGCCSLFIFQSSFCFHFSCVVVVVAAAVVLVVFFWSDISFQNKAPLSTCICPDCRIVQKQIQDHYIRNERIHYPPAGDSNSLCIAHSVDLSGKEKTMHECNRRRHIVF